jgi:hypothetical protein
MMGPIGSMLGVGSIVEGFLGNLGSGSGGGTAPTGMGGGGGGREMFDSSPVQTPAAPVGTAPFSTAPTSCPPGYQLYTQPDGSTTCVPITSGATMARPAAASYYQPVGGEVSQGYAQMSPYAPQLTPVADRGQGISSLQQGGTLPQTFPAGLSSLANR